MSAPGWLEIVRAEIAVRGSIQAVAKFIGISRSALSLALAGKYPSKSTKKLEAKVLSSFAEGVDCPALGETIPREECAFSRVRRSAPSMPDKFKQWAACSTCPVGDALGLPKREYGAKSKPKAKGASHAQR